MQQLPAKDQAVFRWIVKYYETKQYKKGIKAADSILKRHPDHGETLCMKGLTLSYLDKKEEAYNLVRKGLKHDLKSHVCWHVFGLLYRQDREYFESVKCYRQALRIDPDNIQILRDLSLLQIHRRDLTGFAETRRKLLQVKPSNRLNWVGYAIAEHLCQNFEFAWTCIDNYEKTFKEEDVPDYENSELFMYKATIMEEAGKLEEALECLKQHEKSIVDKLGLLETKGRLCMCLERFDEAATIYRRLVKTNPEHHHYILALMANKPEFQRFWPALPAPKVRKPDGEDQGTAEKVPSTISSFPASMHPLGMPIWGWLPPEHAIKTQRRVSIGRRIHKRRLETYQPLVPLTAEEEDAVCAFFQELQDEHPRSDSLQKLLLYFITGERFERRLDAYFRKGMRKGIPALFRMIRPLYFQPGKLEAIEKLLLQYVRCLSEEVSWFGPQPGESPQKPADVEEEPPSCLLFALMVTAEHYDFIGDTHLALQHVDQAIEHTPTLVELYACKARIFKHAGSLEQSAKWFDEVRQLDLADRFLNTQCVRAMLRVDDVQGGMEKALLFSKEPDSPEAANLHDMQCMWYESAVGRSYTRQSKPGKALKKFGETFKHFNDIAEDQFDFHNYCLRKTTLKAYVAMLRMQERLFSHKFYRRAAKDSIKIHLELHDKKARGEVDDSAEVDDDGKETELSASDKRKMKHKNRRAQKKVEEEQAKQATTPSGKPKKVDDDPEGDKLLEKDPMEEASKLMRTLVLYCTLDPATHVLTYEVFSRQGKLLHCLQALIQLYELSGNDVLYYKLAPYLTHFCFVAKLGDEAMPAAVREVIMSELATILGEKEAFANPAAVRKAATKVVDQVEKRLRDTPDLMLIEVLYGLKTLKNAGRDCTAFLKEWCPQGAFALKECQKMLSYLATEYGKESVIW
eukprot:CAMPEP_0170598526 /NCGR_PEP_ID=MMETSP0224-20130122/16298_1 /TAXON_ID=285029 /ORGANISM="Togula jolla, Strain CCCM 725" /LENGTH=911 /DNA_ID=CAMNT_0010923091 /DNA_START=175 /DNA_END=2907 /DNA_ORIENTATION=+